MLEEHCVHSPASAPVVWQAGVGAAQSVSCAHAWHWCVVALQTGVVPEQFASLEHCTHASVAASARHTGPVALPAQSALVAHISHCPTNAPDVAQTGWRSAAAQSVLAPHATQVSVVAPALLQMGVAVFVLESHSASVTQATHRAASGSPAGAQ